MSKWTTKNIESQAGKLAVVTGGTGGLGLEIARELARAGAEVIIAGDRAEKGESASAEIAHDIPGAQVHFRKLNTGDLKSIEIFSNQLLEERRPLDILVNNAGVMGVNPRRLTEEGFEWHFGVNYLGHFALTARLFPLLRRAPQGRIVHQSSLEHRDASIRFNDLQLEKNYDPNAAYAQSKLAQLHFAFELERRARELGIRALSIPVHPGASKTGIFEHGEELSKKHVTSKHWLIHQFIKVFGQSAAQGALPALYAATSPEARGGGFYGPDGFHEIRGYPKRAKVAPQARDQEVAERLWKVSETLAGLRFDLRVEHPVIKPDPKASAGLRVELPSRETQIAQTKGSRSKKRRKKR